MPRRRSGICCAMLVQLVAKISRSNVASLPSNISPAPTPQSNQDANKKPPSPPMRGSSERLLVHEAFALDHETCAIDTSVSRIEPVALTCDIMTAQGGSKDSKKAYAKLPLWACISGQVVLLFSCQDRRSLPLCFGCAEEPRSSCSSSSSFPSPSQSGFCCFCLLTFILSL